MLSYLKEVMDFLGLETVHGQAMIVSCLISWFGTQSAKSLFSNMAGKPCVVLALVLAFTPAYTMTYTRGLPSFWFSLAVAFTAPVAYKIMIEVGRARKWRWVDHLSNEVRDHDNDNDDTSSLGK